MDIDLNDYIAGGYFIVKYADKEWLHTALLPGQVISLSSCISENLNIFWGLDLERNRPDALHFGIPESKLAAFHDWSLNADADSFGIYSLNDARMTVKELLPSNLDVVLIGAVLHREMVDDFLIFKPYPDVHPNYIVCQTPGAERLQKELLSNHFVSEGIPLEMGGEPLGFEVISYHFAWGHSWLCVGLQKDMHELFDIHPNQYGLINTYEEAKKVYDWIAEDKMQGERAEPEPHHPWLIVRYPLA